MSTGPTDPPSGGAPPPPEPDKAQASSASPGTDATPDSPAPSFSSAHRTFDDQAKEYTQGRETLRPPDTTYISGGRDQQVHVGDRIYYQAARRAVAEPGELNAEQLSDLTARYVPVPDYGRMLDDLERRRLLVLVGPPGSGRSTTALRLLAEAADGKVCRLEPEIDLRSVDEAVVGSGRGSLAVMTAPAVPPTQAQADKLATLLAREKSFCVIVATPSPAVLLAFAYYRTDCASPPFTALLRGYLDLALGPDDPPRTAERLIELAEGAEIQQALGPGPRASEVAELAALLVDHSRGELPLTTVCTGAAAFLERRIGRWFSDLGGSPRRDTAERRQRLAALRLALAVFDGLPQHIVGETSALLGERVLAAESALPNPRPPSVLDLDDTLLTALEAEVVSEDIVFGGVAIPSQVIRYRDRRTPAALLTHVWTRHQHLRPAIVAWLAALSTHPQPAVRNRAAQAAGLLAAADFSHAYPALIEPAAGARPRRRSPTPAHEGQVDELNADEERWELRRGFAALALDQAALDGRVAPMVETVLRRWRRSPDHALRWTAARALGFDVGLRSVTRSLDELRVIGTPWELLDIDEVPVRDRAQIWDLRWVAGLGVARLFASGDHHQVIAQLRQWLRDRRKSVRELAQQSVVIMAELRTTAVSTDGVAPGRERWPVLLGLTTDDPSLPGPVGGLLKTVLESGPAGDVLLEMIGAWWDLGESDPPVIDAFLHLLPHVVVDERDRRRLTFAVDERSRRWADPLPGPTADRITAAAGSAVHRTRG